MIKELKNSHKLIYEYLQLYGRKTNRELIRELDLPVRTVRYALRILKKNGFIRSVVNLRDARSGCYEAIEL